MEASEEHLMEAVDRLRKRQLEWTRELVRIPTVNPYSGDDSAGSEAAGQDWIQERMEALGAEIRRIAVPEDVYARGGLIGPGGRSWTGRENVVATWRLGTGTGPVILINNHMDTVGTAGMHGDPFDPVI